MIVGGGEVMIVPIVCYQHIKFRLMVYDGTSL